MAKQVLSSKSSLSQRWKSRLAAFLFGLALIALAEGVCVLFGWGQLDEVNDPFVGFEATILLFEVDEQKSEYRTSPARVRFFAPQRFAATKPANGFRVFCLGGSTVQGRPYSAETSFTTWLRLRLAAADPAKQWEVVNCGGISYASYRLVPILRECLEYEPDVIILFTGHNEFLEDRTYAPLEEVSTFVQVGQKTIGRTRLYRLFRSGANAITNSGDAKSENETVDASDPKESSPTILTTEVSTKLDFDEGLDAYTRDPVWRQGVVDHFAFNVRRMIGMAQSRGVKVIVVSPPSNLADTPPFKSQHRDGVTPEEIQQWTRFVENGKKQLSENPSSALEQFTLARAIDDQYAGLHYLTGLALQSLHRRDQAREAFVSARDHDICPLRLPGDMNRLLHQTAVDLEAIWIDGHDVLEQQCPGGICNDAILVDHVHPSFQGHQHLAAALFEQMETAGWVSPTTAKSHWQPLAERAYAEHFSSLGVAYFAKGRRELAQLIKWSRKRSPQQ